MGRKAEERCQATEGITVTRTKGRVHEGRESQFRQEDRVRSCRAAGLLMARMWEMELKMKFEL